jgi:hypothetical protein
MNYEKEKYLADKNQGVLFLAYTTPTAYNKLVEEVHKRGLGIRELKLIDITIPCNPKTYDDNINFFKHFITQQSDRLIQGLNSNMITRQIIKAIEKKTEYKLLNIDYSTFKRDMKNPLLNTNLTPIAVEYKEGYKKQATPEEQTNYDKLLKFESNGFKPQTDEEAGLVDESKIKNYDDFKGVTLGK